GANVMVGGLGADTLTGGAGADTFKFTSMKDSVNDTTSAGQPKWDVITDFEHGTDKIDLSKIDANPNTTADDAFMKVGSFDSLPGEVVFGAYDANAHSMMIDAFDGTDHFQIEVHGDQVKPADVIF